LFVRFAAGRPNEAGAHDGRPDAVRLMWAGAVFLTPVRSSGGQRRVGQLVGGAATLGAG
jgi:hypothetical protein